MVRTRILEYLPPIFLLLYIIVFFFFNKIFSHQLGEDKGEKLIQDLAKLNYKSGRQQTQKNHCHQHSLYLLRKTNDHEENKPEKQEEIVKKN